MAANSKHYLDVYTWVRRVIQSCRTTIQLEGARKLIVLYKNMYQDNYTRGNLMFVYDLKLKELERNGEEENR